MTDAERATLRRRIAEDLASLKGLEGRAVRRNRFLREDRLFWWGLFWDTLEEMIPGGRLAGRAARRAIARIRARTEKGANDGTQ